MWGEIARLTFDETPASDGTLVARDVVSGRFGSNVCNGEACPTVGQAGQVGKAFYFDGKDDGISIPDSDSVDFGAQDFAVMAWIRPDPAQSWTLTADNDVIEKWSGTGGYPYVIRYVNQTGGPDSGKVAAARWDGTHGASLMSTRGIHDGRFHHVALVRSNGWLKLYVDGVMEGTDIQDSTTGATTNDSAIYIGRRGGSSLQNYFVGEIDDLRIFSGGISSEGIKQIYRGSDPLLVMSFEAPLAVNGEPVTDSSAWGNNGTLSTGSGDTQSKTMTGQVGNYAVKLDGTDDSVSLGDVDVLDGLSDFTISQWFSVDALYPPGSGQELAAPVGKGKWTGAANGWAVLVNQSTNAGDQKVRLSINGAMVAEIPAPTDGNGWQPGRWQHYAFSRSGGTIRGYLDGLERMTPVSSAVVPVANSEPVLLGTNPAGPYPWRGGLDELRIYARGLGPNEIADLYNVGLARKTATASGESVERTSWTMALPSASLGMEGTYRVDLRGTDTKGHGQAVSGRSLWQGEIDNNGPVCDAVRGHERRQGVLPLCRGQPGLQPRGAGLQLALRDSSRVNYQSPWLQSTLPTGQTKLYEVRADCVVPSPC